MMHIDASDAHMLKMLLRLGRLRVVVVEVLHRFVGKRRRRFEHEVDELDEGDEDGVEHALQQFAAVCGLRGRMLTFARKAPHELTLTSAAAHPSPLACVGAHLPASTSAMKASKAEADELTGQVSAKASHPPCSTTQYFLGGSIDSLRSISGLSLQPSAFSSSSCSSCCHAEVEGG